MSHWLFAACLGLLMLLVAVATVRSGLLLRAWTPPFNLLLTWPDVLLRLALTGLCLLLGLIIGPGRAALNWATGSAVGDLWVGLVAGAAMAVVLGVGGFLAERGWGTAVYSTRMLQYILPASRLEWLGVVPALFMAALVEELLFRWLPLAGMAWLVPAPWLLWPLAIFFGLLHWPQGWWGVAGTTLAGAGLSILFVLTGSIWPALIAHYVMNLAQLILAKLTGIQPVRGSDS